ncbi:MAG TPA: mannose-1-phosphate guanylyltransferase [Acidobacteriaceae bacterium]|jgi:mannose-1-phosphate guanylyltransferase|nr:mannose-1-phosphate guanylyltransferase [Acidobacteriaceae bacterium]
MDFRPIILAGGSGTRFWPRSRRSQPKQVLALDGERSMIQQTVDRLLPLAAIDRFWVITNGELQGTIAEQLRGIRPAQVLAEPEARNTAPAAGLAAFLLERTAPEAILGIFPADHVIRDPARMHAVLRRGCEVAAAGENIVVLGITPTRPETGYGYIETGASIANDVLRVRRFTEKPNRERAEEFLNAGTYFWNSGIFLWSARTLANAIRENLPETAPYLEEIAASFGTKDFASRFATLYSRCENISVDYAVLEPRSAKGEHRSNIYCLPADFGWNDLGSWAALYEHCMSTGQHVCDGENVVEAVAQSLLDAAGNYVYAPGKHVALIGVEDLVVVETDDVLLVTKRDRCQDVGKLVKQLQQKKQDELI